MTVYMTVTELLNFTAELFGTAVMKSKQNRIPQSIPCDY